MLTALLFAGRAGTSITAEIGLMKATNQIEAMELMAIDPVQRIALPRFAAGVISVPLLTALFNAMAILGSYVTATKPWLQPELPDAAEIKAILADNRRIHNLKIHGMARLAFDDEYAYVNGNGRSLGPCERDAMAELCALRRTGKALKQAENEDFLAWLITSGAFGMD